MTKYLLAFNGHIYVQQATNLRARIATIFERQDCESLTLLLSSEGGSTDECMSLYNFIRALPRPLHIHAIGHVGSAAIPVFLAGHRRTCTPFSRFFFHAYDWGFEGRQMTDRIQEALQRLVSDIEIHKAIAAKHTKIPAEKLEELYRTSPKPTIFKPDEAKTFGIVEEITELNPSGALQPDTVIWTA